MALLNEFLTDIDFSAIRDYCMANGKSVTYRKGEYFAEEGCLGRYAGIIASGYFKYAVLNTKGDYSVTGFSFEGECVIDFIKSFLSGQPADTSIIAGSDAEVIQCPLDNLRDYIRKSNPRLIDRASEILLNEAYARYIDIHRKSPTERYLAMIDTYPDIIRRVTMRDIASYLLVSPIYLSRIRRKTGK